MNEEQLAAEDHKTVYSSNPADTLPKCPTCGLKVPGLSSCPNDGTKLDLNPLSQTSLAGRYEFLEAIGQGGMSVIFKARQPLLKRTVAIKLMQSHLDAHPQTKLRFEKEGEALSSLAHPNVVAVFDCGFIDNARPFLVMAYVEGKSLSKLLKEEGALSLPRALNIFANISAGLEHAHRRNILHRDLKPSNVMIAGEGADEQAIIVDFGVAKILDTSKAEHELTATGETLGSPPYMSPEQCQGVHVDERSDIYSLGCLMYECLSGQLPLIGRNALETMHKQVNERPKQISSFNGPQSLKPHLQLILDKTLEKDPARRYRSVSDILFDIDLLRDALDKNTVPKLSSLKAYSGQRINQPIIAVSVAALLAVGNFAFWVSWKDNSQLNSKHLNLLTRAEIAGDENLSSLLGNTDLTELVATSVGLRTIKQLPSFAKLNKLTLKQTDVSERSIAPLTSMATLNELSIVDQNLNDDTMSAIAKIPNLQKLTLDVDRLQQKSLLKLKTATKLEELVIHNPDFSVNSVAELAVIPHLSKLTLQATSGHEIRNQDVEAIINALPNLTTLKLESSQINNDGLQKLAKLKYLKRLSLAFSKQITDDGLKSVAALNHLESLNLSGVDVTDKGIEILSHMTDLKELYLWRARISDAAMPQINNMISLRVLHLSNTDITDYGLKSLTGVLNLADLKLKETKITDKSMDCLSNFPRLTRLSLQHVDVTNRGLLSLTRLPLQELDLSETLVSDEGLKLICTIKSLRYLFLKDCPHVSAAAIDSLTTVLPGCHIETKRFMPSRALE